MIPYGHQSIDESDVDAVVAVLRGDWLTQGPAIADFEAALAERVGARHVVAFTSGTAALHGATAAAGLGPGDTVATSPLSFVASANCARYVGADVAFLDIDPDTLNLDPAQLPDALDALVAVHFAGLPVDLNALPYRPRVVIEDACHALGADTQDGPVGNCARSDMCVFSFHPVKTITTGEGGAVSTNSDDLADALRHFRSHGTVPTPERGGWAYDVASLGFNYRMTDLQAALGHSQLRRLDTFLKRRRELAARYDELLAGLPVTLPPRAAEPSTHAYHLYAIRIPHRRRVYDHLRSEGIGAQVHYVPIYQHSLYAPSFRPSSYPNTEAAYEQLLSLPLYPGLESADQDRIVRTLREAL